MNTKKYTLESIGAQRARIGKQLRSKSELMRRRYNSLFAPPPPSHNVVERYVNFAEQAWALFDGVRTGYKVLRRMSGFLHLPRKRKKK